MFLRRHNVGILGGLSLKRLVWGDAKDLPDPYWAGNARKILADDCLIGCLVGCWEESRVRSRPLSFYWSFPGSSMELNVNDIEPYGTVLDD